MAVLMQIRTRHIILSNWFTNLFKQLTLNSKRVQPKTNIYILKCLNVNENDFFFFKV